MSREVKITQRTNSGFLVDESDFSVVVRPLVVVEVGVDDLLHGVVADELVGGQLGPGDRIEVSDAVEMLLDVLARGNGKVIRFDISILRFYNFPKKCPRKTQ